MAVEEGQQDTQRSPEWWVWSGNAAAGTLRVLLEEAVGKAVLLRARLTLSNEEPGGGHGSDRAHVPDGSRILLIHQGTDSAAVLEVREGRPDTERLLKLHGFIPKDEILRFSDPPPPGLQHVRRAPAPTKLRWFCRAPSYRDGATQA